jgi:hypothetical protein
VVLVALVACGGAPVDPELASLGAAVVAADRGEAAFAARDWASARAAFHDALVARPDDALLHAWSGRVEAEAGDVEAALEALDRAIAISPRFGEARLLRARLHARAGHVEAAAADVVAALRLKTITPRAVLRDPDLRALRGEPSFGFLPAAALQARLRAPEGTIFLGSDLEIALDVVGVDPGPITIDVGDARGPIALVRVSEDERTGEDGDRVRSLVWTFRVVGAGQVALGPLRVAQGELVATTAAVHVTTAAPPGSVGEAAPIALPTPSGVLGARTAPLAWQEGTITSIAVPPGGRAFADRVEASTPWTLARDGEPVVDLYRIAAPVQHVRVAREDGAIVLDGAPTP